MGAVMDRRAFLATMAGAAGAAGLVSCHQASGKPAALIHPRRTALAGEAWADADVVVYGATPAGVIAAVSAANLGASAVLIGGWREIQPGGMLAGGLSWTDIRDIDAVGGYARTTMAALAASGGMPGNRYAFDPAVAAPYFRDLLDAAGVPVLWSDGVETVDRTDRAIREIITRSGVRAHGRIFIDASYEGDLMARAGISTRVGREAADRANPYNGYRGSRYELLTRTDPPQKDNILPIDPFFDQPSGRLIAGVDPAPNRPVGAADDGVQAYCFRLTMTDRPELRLDLPATAPDGYREADYELLFRDFDRRRRAGQVYGRDWHFARDLVKADEVAPGIYDINNRGTMSLDAVGLNRAYPAADYDARERIWKAHENYIRGWFHAMAHGRDPRIPAGLQRDVRNWGLVRGRHTDCHPADTPGWSPQLYVREARRLDNGLAWSGRDVSDIDGVPPRLPSIVAMASYWQDSHAASRIAVRDERGQWGIVNEGHFMLPAGGKYQRSPLPFELMVPHRDQCTNLMVPFCVAATHQAFSTIRMEPTSMALGEAAGTAAALAVINRDRVDIQDVDTYRLQQMIVANGGVIQGVTNWELLQRKLKHRLDRLRG
ncbi:FAD-dependent oxidoreductase [Sphingobium yanoikuyae]|uniref:FAD-dependent oxidoreductase n=2 Tax=Sphingobium yanoikuyae TaxID=13690 RepID=A0A6M4G303_SPHYA|nr:FAD-dependent oxidoreductase [Sphingobium yanoikuyae]